jgi:quinol-cytochrome oxidoreductase complex cytochrome b subunit
MSTTTTKDSRSREKAPAGEKVADWADGRLGIYSLAKANMRKIFPDHWSFMLGEICLYSFIIIILTGVYLTLFFHPSMNEIEYHGSYVPLQGQMMSEAFSSTLHISFDVRGGLLIRQIHHWAALVFLAGMFVHMMRVFFTGAFRKPREINWLFGFLLFVLGMFTGFTGYSLPDDLLSGTGVRFTQGAILATPIVGTYISMFLFGGEFPGGDFVSRFYSIHILLLPGIMLGLVVGHLILVFYHKHTQFAGPGKTNKNVVGMPLLPVYMAKAGGFFFLVFGFIAMLSAVASINPIWVLGPYRPDQVSTGAQPDWYMGRRGADPRDAGLGDQPLGPHARPGRVHPAGALRPLPRGDRALSVHRVLDHRGQARAPHPGPAAQRPDPYGLRRRVGHRVHDHADRRWQRHRRHALPSVDQLGHLVRPDRVLRRTGHRVHRHQADLSRPPAPRRGQGAARPRVGHHQAPAAR